MKINRLSVLATAAATVLAANAQVTLNDKQQKVDLGLGVEMSELLSTAAFTTITGEELQQTAATNLADALYGRLPGLTAMMNGGFTGDENTGASFNIRGYHTMNDKGILILVDGYERPIDRLSVEEVESVTVLKDAAAVAMLGHEGVNGAIIVKTKHGQTGATHVTANYSHNFQFDPEFADMVNGYDYANALNKALLNDGRAAAYSSKELELFKSGTSTVYPNVNWRDLIFKNTAHQDHGYVSVWGGSEKVHYYTNIDYVDSRGALKDASQKDYNSQLRQSKANIRANLDFFLTKTTKISVNAFGVFQETKGPQSMNANDLTYRIYQLPASAFPVKTADGVWGGTQAYGDVNPRAAIDDSGFAKTHQRQIWVNGRIDQKLDFWVPGLSFFLGAAYANSSIIKETKSKTHQYGYDYYTDGNVGDPASLATAVYGDKNNNLTFGHWNDGQWWIANGNLGVNYKRSFMPGKDNFSASVIFDTKGESRDGRHNTFYRHNIYGVLHYDLYNKFLADVVLAGNGSNRTIPHRWSFSPTISLGYIYANAPEGGILNYGKVRLSGGIQHTDYMPTGGMWLSTWDASHGYFINGWNYGSSWGASLGSFPTINFKQETSQKINIGNDLRLFNCLDFTIDGWYEKRNHIMLSASEENSYVVGIQSAYSDVGSVNSYGFDMGLKFAKEVMDQFHVNAGFNLGWAHNKITHYIGTPTYPLSDPVGNRVNEAFGYEVKGFFKDQADIDNSPRQEFGTVRPGDIKYVDKNGDGVINAFDQVSLKGGAGLPELNYAFNIGLEYKGIGLNTWWQGTGNYYQNLSYVTGVWSVIGANRNNLSTEYYNNCWDVAGDNALYPRLTAETNDNNAVNSTIWFKKTHFLKMRNLEVYWKLPLNWIKKAAMSNAKIFVQFSNLLSIDNLDTMDSEILSTAYPAFKGVNVGFNITF